MLVIHETEVFQAWMEHLADLRAKALIALRLARLELGHFGDVKPLRDGVFEMRVHSGPGYRVYYSKRGSSIVILLCAGTKRTQDRDVREAKKLAGAWHKDRSSD